MQKRWCGEIRAWPYALASHLVALPETGCHLRAAVRGQGRRVAELFRARLVAAKSGSAALQIRHARASGRANAASPPPRSGIPRQAALPHLGRLAKALGARERAKVHPCSEQMSKGHSVQLSEHGWGRVPAARGHARLGTDATSHLRCNQWSDAALRRVCCRKVFPERGLLSTSSAGSACAEWTSEREGSCSRALHVRGASGSNLASARSGPGVLADKIGCRA